MSDKPPRDPLPALEEALAAEGNRRAPLKQWMLDNYGAVSALLSGKRPNWKRLTEVFMECGFRNTNGTDLQPQNVRLMWLEVRKARQGTPVPSSAGPSPAPGTGAPAVAPRPDGGVSAHEALARVQAELNRRSSRK